MPLETAEQVLANIAPPRKPKKAKAIKPEIVVVAGQTNWTDRKLIKKTLTALNKKAVKYVITGTSKGAELLCVSVCKELGLPVVQVHLPSGYSGESSYHMRNHGVFAFFKPTHVIGFHKNIDESLNTAMYLKLGRKKGCVCQLLPHKAKKPNGKT